MFHFMFHLILIYSQAFVDGSFFESGGKPYCKLHYHAQTGSVCGGCQKAITGRSVNAMGKNWHPEHFVW
jgi:paxillin